MITSWHRPVFRDDSGLLDGLYAAATEEMNKMVMRYPTISQLRDAAQSAKDEVIYEYMQRRVAISQFSQMLVQT
jgi:hypothetical protein